MPSHRIFSEPHVSRLAIITLLAAVSVLTLDIASVLQDKADSLQADRLLSKIQR